MGSFLQFMTRAKFSVLLNAALLCKEPTARLIPGTVLQQVPKARLIPGTVLQTWEEFPPFPLLLPFPFLQLSS